MLESNDVLFVAGKTQVCTGMGVQDTFGVGGEELVVRLFGGL